MGEPVRILCVDDEIRVTVANALERYDLGRKNLELTEELRRKNDELTALNRDLDRRVVERTEALTTQNRLVDEVLEKSRAAGNRSASAVDGKHQAVLERNPYATDCVILIVHGEP